MTPEEKARQQIDTHLTASGWAVQTKDKINLSAARGVAVCELSLQPIPLCFSKKHYQGRSIFSGGETTHLPLIHLQSNHLGKI